LCRDTGGAHESQLLLLCLLLDLNHLLEFLLLFVEFLPSELLLLAFCDDVPCLAILGLLEISIGIGSLQVEQIVTVTALDQAILSLRDHGPRVYVRRRLHTCQ
jgi:hypothetical protein